MRFPPRFFASSAIKSLNRGVRRMRRESLGLRDGVRKLVSERGKETASVGCARDSRRDAGGTTGCEHWDAQHAKKAAQPVRLCGGVRCPFVRVRPNG